MQRTTIGTTSTATTTLVNGETTVTPTGTVTVLATSAAATYRGAWQASVATAPGDLWLEPGTGNLITPNVGTTSTGPSYVAAQYAAAGSDLVVFSGAATGSGPYSVVIPAQAFPTLVTLRWTAPLAAGAAFQTTTFLDVVGARLFSLAEARASNQVLANTTNYPTATLEDLRTQVEDEAWTIGVNRPTRYDPAAGEVGGLSDFVPTDLRRAALLRLRTVAGAATSAIPERAISWQPAEGGNFSLAVAGRAGFTTGIPDVDAIYQRYNDSAGLGVW